jgi:hypothetical protein
VTGSIASRPEVPGHDPLHLGHVALANLAEGLQQHDDLAPSGQRVQHALAISPGLDQRGTPQDLEVARGVRECQRGARRNVLDAAPSLSQMLQQLQPMRMAERLRDLGQAGDDGLFRSRA